MTDPRTVACRDYLVSVGGRRHSRPGHLEVWYVPLPGNRRGRLQVEFKVGRLWNGWIAIDRWGCRNSPPEAEPWFEEHLHPEVDATLVHTPRRTGFLATGGSYSCAMPLRSNRVPGLLRRWVDMELAWQSQQPEAEVLR